MIRLSAFADEISPELDEQIAVLKEEGITLVELRSVWNINVLELTDDQVTVILERFSANGIGVSAIGSPIGKVPIDAPLADELRRLERAIELARRFDAALIRIFSYYPGAGMPSSERAAYREDALERLARLAALAGSAGVTLVHENDADLYGDTAERCVDILKTVDSPSLKAAFDPANFIVSSDIPYPAAYDLLLPWLAHVHVKDAVPERTVVAAGEGAARWPELLERLRADGYDGLFSLEPHLTAAGRHQGFSGPDLFQHASRQFKGILQRMEWTFG